MMIFSDEGCVRHRRTDAGQKSEDCVNSDSPVIAAFKGEENPLRVFESVNCYNGYYINFIGNYNGVCGSLFVMWQMGTNRTSFNLTGMFVMVLIVNSSWFIKHL